MQFFDGNCSDFLFSLFSGYLQNVIICDKNISIIWHVEESPRSKAMVILLTENDSEDSLDSSFNWATIYAHVHQEYHN